MEEKMVSTLSFGVSGVTGYPVRVEVFCTGGLPSMEIIGLPENVMEFWVGLIAQELDLLRGVLSNDSARFKNLKE